MIKAVYPGTFDPVPLPDLETEDLGVERHRRVRLVGDDLDVVDAFEHW